MSSTHLFAHPNNRLPLLQAYDEKFEACYVILHEFCQWDDLQPNQDFEQKAKRILWQDVLNTTGIKDFGVLQQLLLARINARKLPDEHDEAATRLEQFANGLPHFQFPDEGMFNDLNLAKYVNLFKSIESNSVVYVPEFPADKCSDIHWAVENLKQPSNLAQFDWMLQSESLLITFEALEKIEFPYRGTVMSRDKELLLTVDHESSFTLLYGAHNKLEHLIQQFKFEGFFADDKTTHLWYI